MALAFSLALLGCDDSPSPCQGSECKVQPDPCPDRNPLRNLYVGELQIHSSLSFDAEFRARMEPLVEVFQHKGSSECKPGILSSDEQCGFESYNKTSNVGPPVPDPNIPPLSYVRNGLKEGWVQEELIGVNPFQFGMIGATDGHLANSGMTNENDYRNTGHFGALDWEPRRLLAFLPASGIESNGGGLAFVWAEENTRDAIFDALRRREVYATSGTRPVLRLFGG